MNFAPVQYNFLLQDAVYSMAAGFMTGFAYHFLSVFLHRGKIRIFIRDFITCVIFAVLLFSYCVSFTNYHVLRWYNVLFAVLGCVFFSPCFDVCLRVVLKLIQITAVHFMSSAILAIRGKADEIKRKSAEKRQKIPQKNTQELLKQEDVLLYN